MTSILQELPADLWAQLIYSRLQQKDCVRKVTVSFSSSLLLLSPLLSLHSPLPFLLPFSLLPSPSSSLPLPLPLPFLLPTSPPPLSLLLPTSPPSLLLTSPPPLSLLLPPHHSPSFLQGWVLEGFPRTREQARMVIYRMAMTELTIGCMKSP